MRAEVTCVTDGAIVITGASCTLSSTIRPASDIATADGKSHRGGRKEQTQLHVFHVETPQNNVVFGVLPRRQIIRPSATDSKASHGKA